MIRYNLDARERILIFQLLHLDIYLLVQIQSLK